MKKLIIAIDGPAGAGKSTVGKQLAQKLGYTYIDTGAMYRALAWKALQSGIPLDDEARLTRLAETTRITLTGRPDALRVFIDGEEVTEAIRTLRVGEAASRISALSGVRQAMVAEQRRMGRRGGVVLEGRDIGTRVFPDADVKFYLDADLEVRARRRWKEERARGRRVSLEEARREIQARDARDRERRDSPLRRAEDAIYIDSSTRTIQDVVNQMLAFIHQKN